MAGAPGNSRQGALGTDQPGNVCITNALLGSTCPLQFWGEA